MARQSEGQVAGVKALCDPTSHVERGLGQAHANLLSGFQGDVTVSSLHC